MMRCIDKNVPIAFIMPHRRLDNKYSKTHIDKAAKSILKQTDTNLFLVIIDDYLPEIMVREYLQKARSLLLAKIHLLFNDVNLGTST